MTTAVILGAAVWPDGPSPTLRRRTLHGAALFHAGQVQQIVCCGGMGQHPPTEARVMHDILVAQGVPKAAILQEDRSNTTAENLRNALPLLHGDDVIIVSDSYHLPRALLMARRLGMQARGNAPPWQGARRGQQIKSTLREIPAYILYWLRFR
jgi:uncharacterized SAM-binding protein YcdF (DUF218 family)